jgi:hypothetical protein
VGDLRRPFVENLPHQQEEIKASLQAPTPRCGEYKLANTIVVNRLVNCILNATNSQH